MLSGYLLDLVKAKENLLAALISKEVMTAGHLLSLAEAKENLLESLIKSD
jgi:hypothetical protein